MRPTLGVIVIALACGGAHDPPAVTIAPLPAPDPPPARAEPPPAVPENKLDINFENKVHLIVARVPEHAGRGERVELSFTWRCDEPLGEGWQLLTHVMGENGKSDNLDYAGPLRETDTRGRQRLGPERWEAGRTYVDTQSYRIPEWATGRLTVLVGIWRSDQRLRIVSGANDGENRALAGRIDVN